MPLAAGENHYTRFEFNRVIEDGAITILQPDLSKTRRHHRGAAHRRDGLGLQAAVHPHTSMTGLNMAATIHFLAAIDNGGYFEATSRRRTCSATSCRAPGHARRSGLRAAREAPGIGVEVDEAFLHAHPVIEGPAYV